MCCWAPPFLCYCWQSESGGRPPSGQSCSCKSFQSDPSDAVKSKWQQAKTPSASSFYRLLLLRQWIAVFTSRMKNLAVLALLQVFFSRDTGLMFIPAEKENVYIYIYILTMNTRRESMLRDYKMNNSQIIAMSELKFPMLKHSLATSMKNSITWALCFFFAGCSSETKHKTTPPKKQPFFKILT